jgi:hypothetical protein
VYGGTNEGEDNTGDGGCGLGDLYDDGGDFCGLGGEG